MYPELQADLILFNGKIITVDRENSVVKAVAVRDGRILKVGTNAQVKRMAGTRTKAIDLDGKTVIPGLIDSHMHPGGSWGAYLVRGVACGPDFTKVDEMLSAVKKKVAETPPGNWIFGYSMDDVKMGRYPTLKELDEASPSNPLYIQRRDGHNGVANSLALQIAGITRETPDPPHGKIEHDEKGEPTGLLHETRARGLKRQWFHQMLKENGSYAKVGYLDEKPVAQALFYPEEAIPYLHNPRKDVIYLKCIFNSNAEAQRKGVADALMKTLLEECRSGLECLGDKPSQLVVTQPFPHEGNLPLADFYKKYGFKEGQQEMYLEIDGRYTPMKVPEFHPLPEDHGRTIIAYNPDCEWGYYYATTTRDLIQSKHPEHPAEIFNSWVKPDEYKKRGGGWMLIAVGIIVNARIPENPFLFWSDREAFLRNVEKALK